MARVRRSAVPLALTWLLPAVLAAAAPAARNISPIFHQLVLFTLPSPFRAVFEKTNGGFYIREHLPVGETLDAWTRMITLTGSSNLASDPRATPQQYLQAMTRGFQHHCPDTFATADLGPAAVHGYAGYALVASCGHVDDGSGKGHSETAIMLAVKGSADLYTLQWAERGADSGRALTIDRSYWQAQLAKLQPIRLCPIVAGEPAPYASCQ